MIVPLIDLIGITSISNAKFQFMYSVVVGSKVA